MSNYNTQLTVHKYQKDYVQKNSVSRQRKTEQKCQNLSVKNKELISYLKDFLRYKLPQYLLMHMQCTCILQKPQNQTKYFVIRLKINWAETVSLYWRLASFHTITWVFCVYVLEYCPDYITNCSQAWETIIPEIKIENEKMCLMSYEKMCLMSYANNKCADQPAHPRSLISAFVVRCLESIISLDSIAEMSRF